MKRILSTLTILSLSILAFAAPKNKPLIGVSPSSQTAGSSSTGHTYITAVRKAGGIPVILPAVKTAEDAKALISKLNGLLMTGGEDVNPAYYGEQILNQTVKINAARDTSDMLLIDAAVKARVPLLGICRGCQIINVYFGGTLYQDLPTQHPSDIRHSQKLPGHIATHRDCVVKGTRMHKLFPVDTIDVNSTHHQAVKTLGKGLKANCISSDGIIEGYEGDRVFATQFHPEKFIYAGNDTLLPVFNEFVNSAKAVKVRK